MEKTEIFGLFTRLGLVSEFLPIFAYADQWKTFMTRLGKTTRAIWIKYEQVFIDKLLIWSRRPLFTLDGKSLINEIL